MKTFKVNSHYSRNNEEKQVRYMTLAEAKGLRYGDHVLVLSHNGQWATAKVNGAPKVWKSSPLKCRIPLKYGMYEYFYADFNKNTSETNLVVEV